MKKNMNNRSNAGFSLVELIIVIAIMAVLIGVLAPQFLKYVESSKKSTDIQNVAEIVTAINTYCADPDNTAADVVGSITLKSGGSTDVTANDTTTTATPERALFEYGIDKYGLKSTEWPATTGGNLTFTVAITNGVPVCTVTGEDTKLSILKGDKDKSK